MIERPTDYRRFLRPSFLPVLGVCSAAARMSHAVVELFGEPPTADVADLGSDMHAANMLALAPLARRYEPGDIDMLPEEHVAATLAKFPGLSGWDQACVRRCVEFAEALLRKTRHDYPDEPIELLLEHDMDGSLLGIAGGTADLVIVVPFRLVRVVDWKCGFLDQGEAADHDSLAAYSTMAAATFQAKGVESFLFQPRADKALRASGARFNGEELRASATWTRAIVEAAMDENPEAVAGLHCTKCRAVTRCAAAKELWMRYKDMLETIGLPSDAEAWGNLVDAAKVAKGFQEEALEQAKGHAIAGGAIARWKLQPSGVQRTIDAKLAVKLAQDHGVMHLLLEHVSVKASAADAIEAIAPAVSEQPKAPSLKPVKASAKDAA